MHLYKTAYLLKHAYDQQPAPASNIWDWNYQEATKDPQKSQFISRLYDKRYGARTYNQALALHNGGPEGLKLQRAGKLDDPDLLKMDPSKADKATAKRINLARYLQAVHSRDKNFDWGAKIDDWLDNNDASKSYYNAVIAQQSGGRSDAIGDQGRASGILQVHRPFFLDVQKYARDNNIAYPWATTTPATTIEAPAPTAHAPTAAPVQAPATPAPAATTAPVYPERSITVQQGDNLWKFWKDHKKLYKQPMSWPAWQKDFRQKNPDVKPTSLKPGQKLWVSSNNNTNNNIGQV